MKLTAEQLIQELSTTIDPTLARQVIESYVEMQQRFLAGDWKLTELDGGRLCEAVSRAVYQLDSGTVTHSQLPGEIRKKLLDEDRAARPHKLPLKDRQHITNVINTIYEFRSDRGVVHISPQYSADGMDSMFVVHAGKWILAEFLRLAWNKDRSVVAGVIEQVVQLELPFIHDLEGKPLVLAKGIPAPEEILLLLSHAANNRLTRTEIRRYAFNQKQGTLNAALRRLLDEKDVRAANTDEIALTPKGQKRVLERIIPKWQNMV